MKSNYVTPKCKVRRFSDECFVRTSLEMDPADDDLTWIDETEVTP